MRGDQVILGLNSGFSLVQFWTCRKVDSNTLLWAPAEIPVTWAMDSKALNLANSGRKMALFFMAKNPSCFDEHGPAKTLAFFGQN
jgi:hypothetical protein